MVSSNYAEPRVSRPGGARLALVEGWGGTLTGQACREGSLPAHKWAMSRWAAKHGDGLVSVGKKSHSVGISEQVREASLVMTFSTKWGTGPCPLGCVQWPVSLCRHHTWQTGGRLAARTRVPAGCLCSARALPHGPLGVILRAAHRSQSPKGLWNRFPGEALWL